MVIKLPTYLPTNTTFDPDMSLVKSDLEDLKKWGTKLMRLGVMWESVETSPG
jgi:hypothetical protein